MSSKQGHVTVTPVAESIPFDNSTNGFTADDVQEAIEEVQALVANSASPGWSFGRANAVQPLTWLLHEGVSSNITGRMVTMTDATIRRVFVSNQMSATFDLELYEHDGTTFTLLGTISMITQRSGVFSVSFPVTTGKEIAVKQSTGQSNNLVVGLLVKGTLA
jgi:hypothetical protein